MEISGVYLFLFPTQKKTKSDSSAKPKTGGRCPYSQQTTTDEENPTGGTTKQPTRQLQVSTTEAGVHFRFTSSTF